MGDGDDQRMDVSDSRKRSFFDSDHDHTQSNKRTNSNGAAAGDVLLKQLIPGSLAGAVLGKGGETISKLQTETSTHIKMSKSGDFYPGTTDRVCIIVGSPEHVKLAHTLIWTKLQERIEASSFGEECKMRLVVPHATVGMIIGKGGSYIKQIKDTTGAFVQISQKANENHLVERTVTIAGSQEAMSAAFDMVFKMIVEDPQSGSCPTLSYADFHGPIPNANHSGSPYAVDMFMGQSMPNMINNQVRPVSGPAAAASAVMKSGGPQQFAAIEAVKATLRNAGHSIQATDEITTAMCTLANYGLLGMGLGFGPYGYGIGGVGAVGGGIGGLSMEYLTGILCGAAGAASGGYMGSGNEMSDKKAIEGGFCNGGDGFNSGFGGYSSQMGGFNSNSGRGSHDQVSEELQVVEALVGAVLGHGGKAIVEIQKGTGATVQISKKGVFAPGTRNRVVTVSGTRNAVDRALYHVRQCIQQEEEKRSRQDMLMKM